MTSIFQLAANLQAMLTQQNYLETGGGLPGPLTMSCHLQHQGRMSLEREWMFFTFIPLRLRGKGQIFLRTKVGEGRGLGDIHSKKITRKVIRACIYWPLPCAEWVTFFYALSYSKLANLCLVCFYFNRITKCLKKIVNHRRYLGTCQFLLCFYFCFPSFLKGLTEVSWNILLMPVTLR